MTFDGRAWGEEIVGVVRGFVAAQVAPLMQRIKDLEARPAPVGIAGAIKSADGVLILTLTDGRTIDTGIRDGARGIDAELPDLPTMVSAAVSAEAALLAEAAAPVTISFDPSPLAADIEGLRAALDERDAAIREMIAALPKPQDGKSVTLDDVRPLVEEAAAKAVAGLPPAKDGEPGQSADMDEVRSLIEAAVERRIAEIPAPKDGEPGKDGRLPIVKAWEDRVYYAGDVCSFDGATWQASTDTGRPPPHDDWMCLAARGEPGRDADQIEPRGLFDPEGDYRRLSIVMRDGASFIARRDNPGPCPGDGWYLLAQQGKRGAPGLVTKGDRGRGVASIDVSGDGVLTLRMDDGSTVECDLYPLLSRLG